MKCPTRAVIGLIAVASACGGDGGESTAPATPREVVIVSGNQQTGTRGNDPLLPLRVRVLGSDGKAFPGATVKWAATQGYVTLEPVETVTDANGETETHVTLLASTGVINVSATVAGLTPASFLINSLDPCSVFRRMTTDSTLDGRLHPLDCEFFEGRVVDFYGFSLTAQQAVSAHSQSGAFDTALWLWTAGYTWALGMELDSTDGTRDAGLKAILRPGTWVFGVTSSAPAATGAYALQFSSEPESANDCEHIWVTADITTTQQLVSTDCVNPSDGSHYDAFFIALHQGAHVTITQSSTAFIPELRLVHASGQLVAEASGNSSGVATLDVTSDSSAFYRLVASASDAQATGGYTLQISPLTIDLNTLRIISGRGWMEAASSDPPTKKP
jgi:hypothetical protein